MNRPTSFFKLTFLGVILSTFCLFASAQPGDYDRQKTYRTQSGHVKLLVVHQDTMAFLQSYDLHTIVDFDEAHLSFRLDLATLTSNNDTMAKYIASIPSPNLTFQGRLNQEYINPNTSQNLSFRAEGTLRLNEREQSRRLDGRLLSADHSANIAFILQMSFDINIRQFGLEQKFPHTYRFIHVTITQPILREQEE